LGRLAAVPVVPTWPLLFWRTVARANLAAVHAPFPSAAVAIATHFPHNVGLIVHWHSDAVIHPFLRTMVEPFTRAMLRRADAIIVSSPSLVLLPVFTELQDKVQVVPFGVDTHDWNTPISGQGRLLMARLKSAHPRLVVALDRLVGFSGFDLLIEAMRSIDAHLLIVGEGPRRNWLQRQIDDNDLSDRVTLWGAASHLELRAILAAADVFASPSLLPDETSGITQLEAMACGLPIVNTALSTGAPRVARNGREAITVMPGSGFALTDAIQLLLTDRVLAGRLGSAGRARATESFSLSIFEHRVAQAYNRVIAKYHPLNSKMLMPSVAMTEAKSR